MAPDDLKGIDLNLLVAFNALMDERSVSRAARRLQVTQPAMSKTLQRLRELFADPLFQRTGRGLVPTARSLALQQPVMATLDQLIRLVTPADFQPAQLECTYTLAVPDVVAAYLVPPLLERLVREAPGVTVRLRNYRRDSIRALPRGTLDFVVGLLTESAPAGLHASPLFMDRSVCLMRQGHPLAGRVAPPLEELLTFGHIRAGFKGMDGEGSLDVRLQAQGHRRHICLETTHVMTLVRTLQTSDALVVGLRHWAALPSDTPLTWVELPPSLASEVGFHLLWDQRCHGDLACRWFRRLLAEVAADLEQGLGDVVGKNGQGGRASGGFLS